MFFFLGDLLLKNNSVRPTVLLHTWPLCARSASFFFSKPICSNCSRIRRSVAVSKWIGRFFILTTRSFGISLLSHLHRSGVARGCDDLVLDEKLSSLRFSTTLGWWVSISNLFRLSSYSSFSWLTLFSK